MSEKAQQKQRTRRKSGTARPEDPEQLRRQLEALDLREAGLTYRQIGARLGVSHTAAHNMVMKALQDTHDKLDEKSSAVLRMELDRLDRMHLGLWPKAAAGSPQHVDRVLRVMERRARLLGLDAPTKSQINVDVTTLTDEQLEALARGT